MILYILSIFLSAFLVFQVQLHYSPSLFWTPPGKDESIIPPEVLFYP